MKDRYHKNNPDIFLTLTHKETGAYIDIVKKHKFTKYDPVATVTTF